MKTNYLLFLIIGLGLLLRVWQLGVYPATLYGDEQAFSWNAYNILKTGQDEYGTSYPLQFRSFDDYKAPVPVYLLVPLFALFGMTPFIIRLPIALAGVLTIPATYWLARRFFTKRVSLLSAFFLAISPWHIHVSRGYFETTLALAFFVTAVAAYVHARSRLALLLVSTLFFSLTIYTYFTPRILLLLFLPFLFFWEYRREKRQFSLRNQLIAFIVFGVVCSPLAWQTVFGKGLSRFDTLTQAMQSQITQTVNHDRTTSLLADPWRILAHNKGTGLIRAVSTNYFEQLSLNFWYLYGDSSLRYFLGSMGMFYLLELPFLAVGLWVMLRHHPRASWLFIGWVLLAPIPAALVGKPFGLRSLAILPVPFLFVAVGVNELMRLFRSRWLMLIIVLGFTGSLTWCLMRYYFEYPVYAATWWGWENKAALDVARQHESEYDQVFISDFYSGATLAYAVYNQVDPMQYREAIAHPVTLADGRHLIKIGHYYFGSLDMDPTRLGQRIIPPKSLYIARPEEPPSSKSITAPDDGRVLFYVYTTR